MMLVSHSAITALRKASIWTILLPPIPPAGSENRPMDLDPGFPRRFLDKENLDPSYAAECEVVVGSTEVEPSVHDLIDWKSLEPSSTGEHVGVS